MKGPVIDPITAQTMIFGTPASFDMKIVGGYGALACTAHTSGGAVTDAGIAFGYVMNHVIPRWQSSRNRALLDTLAACL